MADETSAAWAQASGSIPVVTPAPPGFRAPAAHAPHERCVIAWPTMRRFDTWRGHLGAARDTYAIVARAINEYEPVLVVADEGEGRAAEDWLRGEVEVVELPIDDAWLRDNGPIILTDGRGGRLAVDFGFNGWGGRATPFDRDANVGNALCRHLGIERVAVPMVLEGGSIALDGAGTLIATEQCLLDPNRNPGVRREDLEHTLCATLGVERIVWLEKGLERDGTDGHADNIVSFVAPGKVLLQTTTDTDDPDHAAALENERRLTAQGIETCVIDVLPHVECFDEVVEIPYVNLYVANGAVFVPLAGAAADREVLRTIESCYPGRDVVGVPGRVLAYGGGGIHRMTQPVPAMMGA